MHTLFKLVHLAMPNFWAKINSDPCDLFQLFSSYCSLIVLSPTTCCMYMSLHWRPFILDSSSKPRSIWYIHESILQQQQYHIEWRTSVQAGSTCVHMYHPRMPCELHSLGHDTHNSPGGNGPVGWWGNQLIEFDDGIIEYDGFTKLDGWWDH